MGNNLTIAYCQHILNRSIKNANHQRSIGQICVESGNKTKED